MYCICCDTATTVSAEEAEEVSSCIGSAVRSTGASVRGSSSLTLTTDTTELFLVPAYARGAVSSVEDKEARLRRAKDASVRGSSSLIALAADTVVNEASLTLPCTDSAVLSIENNEARLRAEGTSVREPSFLSNFFSNTIPNFLARVVKNIEMLPLMASFSLASLTGSTL